MLFFIIITSLLQLQADAQECRIHLNCNDCIGTAGCSWCASDSPPFQDGAPHCDTTANLMARNCETIEDPQNREISIKMSDATNNPVSVTDVELSLRVGLTHQFRVMVTPLRNLPLDLYILIDLSGSMYRELMAIQRAVGDIANPIKNVTDNIRIGFGSFNDKITRPYTYFPVPLTPGGSCHRGIDCSPNYAFRHQITLTNDTDFYSRALQRLEIAGNVDNPENGLEGLAQVVACEKIIGWRNRSATGMERGLTRVVLFMTDAAFHYAGEGQLAGILKPYRGECLLDPPPSDAGAAGATEFTRWREVDYPSVGQIVQMLHEKEVSVIFAVEEQRLNTYRNLSHLINLWSRASVSRLEANPISILNLINNEIPNILQAVSLHPDESGNLNVTITPLCPSNSPILPNGRGCDNVSLGTPVQFQVSVTLNSCEGFQQPGIFRTYRIVVPGFGAEFAISYTGVCKCSCCMQNITSTTTDSVGNTSGTTELITTTEKESGQSEPSSIIIIGGVICAALILLVLVAIVGFTVLIYQNQNNSKRSLVGTLNAHTEVNTSQTCNTHSEAKGGRGVGTMEYVEVDANQAYMTRSEAQQQQGVGGVEYLEVDTNPAYITNTVPSEPNMAYGTHPPEVLESDYEDIDIVLPSDTYYF